MLNITLAPDDIRIKYPAYGLSVKMPLHFGSIKTVDLYGSVVTHQYFIDGKWIPKNEIIFTNAFTDFMVTLDVLENDN